MKSEKAKVYIEDMFISEYNDIDHDIVHFGDNGVVLEKGRIGRCRRYADKAVEIAEQEAERRHEAEMKSILKARIKDINALSRNFNEILDELLKAERDKVKDAFCNGCECLIPASCPCAAFDHFVNRLSAR